MKILNEQVVMDFFLEELSQNNISFLADRVELRESVRSTIQHLKECEDLHEKILVSKELWKLLFDGAMSFIDSNKKGYDNLFSYFDVYVDFEELIFASDSFYRDHTLHSLWVYFLGEYLFRNAEFQPLWRNFNKEYRKLVDLKILSESLDSPNIFGNFVQSIETLLPINQYEEAIRCIICLTHDLGYPLTKIAKINKSIKKILPFFAVFNIEEFKFKFDTVQQFYISKFLELLGYRFLLFTFSGSLDFESNELIKEIAEELDSLYNAAFNANTVLDEEVNKVREKLKKLNPKQIYILNQLFQLRGRYEVVIPRMLRFSNDFENFKHGIMSSFLLVKLLEAFSNIEIHYSDPSNIPLESSSVLGINTKLEILASIANHTSSGFSVKNFNDYSSFLILIDEIEEFSRISRANQFRQFVNEFCKTAISFENNCLIINFIFDNKNIADLNPEIFFKGKARKFLNLFDIVNFDPEIKIKFIVSNNLSSKKELFELLIGRDTFEIAANGEKQNTKSYLKTFETTNFENN